jgi:hypothetical protein
LELWKERIKRVLHLCSVEGYSTGTVEHPDNPLGAKIWDYNDNYTQVIIVNNISSTEMVHISQCNTVSAMWNSLEAVHETKGHQTTIGVLHNLFCIIADDDTDMNLHLSKLKTYWERMALLGDKDLHISDPIFKVIISSSLPVSWDTFTEQYVGGQMDVVENNPKKLMNSQKFIGILKEEYA